MKQDDHHRFETLLKNKQMLLRELRKAVVRSRQKALHPALLGLQSTNAQLPHVPMTTPIRLVDEKNVVLQPHARRGTQQHPVLQTAILVRTTRITPQETRPRKNSNKNIRKSLKMNRPRSAATSRQVDLRCRDKPRLLVYLLHNI